MPAGTPWRLEDGSQNIFSSDWANLPSEQYAETAIVLVLGERPVSTNAPITAEGIEVVKAWAQKKNLACISRAWTCPMIEFVRQFASGGIDGEEVVP